MCLLYWKVGEIAQQTTLLHTYDFERMKIQPLGHDITDKHSSKKFLENYRKLAGLIGILSSVTPVVFHSHVLMRLQTCPINWVGRGGGGGGILI